MDTDEILERTTWNMFWVPPAVRIIDRPELLYLCSPRPSTTLNMVAHIRPRNADHAAELVGEVAAAHAGWSSRFQLTARSGTPLLRPELESAGYALAHEHYSMALAVEDFTPRRSTGIEVRRVADLAGLKDNISVGEAAFGKTSVFTEAELPQQVRECQQRGAVCTASLPMTRQPARHCPRRTLMRSTGLDLGSSGAEARWSGRGTAHSGHRGHPNRFMVDCPSRCDEVARIWRHSQRGCSPPAAEGSPPPVSAVQPPASVSVHSAVEISTPLVSPTAPTETTAGQSDIRGSGVRLRRFRSADG